MSKTSQKHLWNTSGTSDPNPPNYLAPRPRYENSDDVNGCVIENLIRLRWQNFQIAVASRDNLGGALFAFSAPNIFES